MFKEVKIGIIVNFDGVGITGTPSFEMTEEEYRKISDIIYASYLRQNGLSDEDIEEIIGGDKTCLTIKN